MRIFRVKKDTVIYHPTLIVLLKGSKLKAKTLSSIIFGVDGIVNVDPKVAEEHFEEIDDNEN